VLNAKDIYGYLRQSLAVIILRGWTTGDGNKLARLRSWYGLATAGSLRALGCQLVGTDVYEGNDLLPLSDRYIEAVVCAYPAGVGDYAALDRGARARLRESLSARYAAVLRAFDPRRSVAEET
jgi:hypothetical protein